MCWKWENYKTYMNYKMDEDTIMKSNKEKDFVVIIQDTVTRET